MVIYEDRCVGCSTIFGYCLGGMCPNNHVAIHVCDECEDETDLYEFDGQELCIECIKEKLVKVAG